MWRHCPDAPSQEVGHWSRIILYMERIFVDPTRGVLFKILTTQIPPMVRAAITEYAQCYPWLTAGIVRLRHAPVPSKQTTPPPPPPHIHVRNAKTRGGMVQSPEHWLPTARGWLVVLATSKAILGRVPTSLFCLLVCSFSFNVLATSQDGYYIAALLRNQVAGNMTQYPTHSHYPDTKLTSPCPTLLMPSTTWENCNYNILIHWFDSARVRTRGFESHDLTDRLHVVGGALLNYMVAEYLVRRVTKATQSAVDRRFLIGADSAAQVRKALRYFQAQLIPNYSLVIYTAE